MHEGGRCRTPRRGGEEYAGGGETMGGDVKPYVGDVKPHVGDVNPRVGDVRPNERATGDCIYSIVFSRKAASES